MADIKRVGSSALMSDAVIFQQPEIFGSWGIKMYGGKDVIFVRGTLLFVQIVSNVAVSNLCTLIEPRLVVSTVVALP
jgi:hypothetical protein